MLVYFFVSRIVTVQVHFKGALGNPFSIKLETPLNARLLLCVRWLSHRKIRIHRNLGGNRINGTLGCLLVILVWKKKYSKKPARRKSEGQDMA